MDMEVMLFSPVGIFGMMCACENTVASTMRTGCPAADRSQASAGSSGTPKLAFSGWNGGGKTLCGTCSAAHRTFYDHKVRLLRNLLCGDTRVYLEIPIRRVLCTRCGKVKREALAVLADNPSYTKRFAYYVGQRCRTASIWDVAKDVHLDWHTVKELEKQYMQEQLR